MPRFLQILRTLAVSLFLLLGLAAFSLIWLCAIFARPQVN